MPHEPAGRPQTPGEARDGVGAPLLTTAAVCALLGVQRNALARYRAAGLPFVILAPGVYRYRRADLDAWLAARTVTGHGGGTGDEEVRQRLPVTCPCGCRWTVKAGGRCPQCARGSHRRPA